nr:hypothetical protein [Tanacetum cinerariifolium]
MQDNCISDDRWPVRKAVQRGQQRQKTSSGLPSTASAETSEITKLESAIALHVVDIDGLMILKKGEVIERFSNLTKEEAVKFLQEKFLQDLVTEYAKEKLKNYLEEKIQAFFKAKMKKFLRS